MASPAQSATVEIIWQPVAIQEQTSLAGHMQNTPTMKAQATFTVDTDATGTITAWADLQALIAKYAHIPWPYRLFQHRRQPMHHIKV